jgi:hypothetical protein
MLETYSVSLGVAKYSGLHAFRHFFASWCINRKVDGGALAPVGREQPSQELEPPANTSGLS